MKPLRVARVLGRLVVVPLVAAALFAASGCDKTAACRPGTLFVELTLNDAVASADQLHIVVVTDTRRETTIPYNGKKTVEVSFPNGAYPAGASADITIEALAAGAVVGVATRNAFTLPKSCGALELTFTAGGVDLSVGDIGAVDAGLDQGVPDLPEGADLTETSTLLPNGSVCSAAGDCDSGNCVDGVCCNSACDGNCEACDVVGSEGTCAGVDGAPHGERTACGGAGVCAGACVASAPKVCTFPGAAITCRMESCTAAVKTLAAQCDGAGACPAESTFACPSSACNGTTCLGGCTTNAECASTGSTPYCNLPEGVCRATKDEGETCTANAQCTSNFCVDGFCCDVACNGQCQACNVTTGGNKAGSCTKLSTGQPVTNAGTTRAACTGTGTCKGSCDGTSPTACGYPGSTVDCGTNCGCFNGASSCTCSSTCATAKRTPRSCNGAGTCVDGTQTTCTNNTCNTAATDCGTCTTDAQCGSGRYCDGTACRPKKADGNACSASGGDHECTNGHCVGSICCATACGGTTPACKANGSGCACTAGSCTGGLSCINDACCNNSCPACQTSTSTNACGNACNTVCSKSCVSGVCCSTTCPSCRTSGSVTNECGQNCGASNCTTSCNGAGTCCRSAEPSCHTATIPNDGCGGTYPANCTGSGAHCDGACGCLGTGEKCCPGAGGGWTVCSGTFRECQGTGGCCNPAEGCN